MIIIDLCYTPDSIAGDCRSIYECPSALAYTQGRITRRTADYLRSIQCENGIGQYPHVCCTIFNGFEQWPAPQLSQPVTHGRTINANIPGLGSCGLTSLAHRIYGGDETQLDDYPWMALLEYQARKYLSISIQFVFHSPLEREKKRNWIHFE